MRKAKDIILTAGPSISEKEIDYVLDAVKNGWNIHHADYIHSFEHAFAKYIGVKYSLTTSGGTGALWLGLAALGVGPGDEVIIPEITFFACSDVVKLLGAKPVFVDVLKDTWCMDSEKFKQAVTNRTKAVMPVHIYGNLCEMDEILKIARKHNIKVIEDACPAIGSVYKGNMPGSFGHCAAFSFQGAKIMVTGFGGMFVTNDRKLYDKGVYLNTHGEDPKKKFWQTSVGYSFEMPNIAAALGLAQLERINQFVNKKRRIFDWYYKRLKVLDGISMNIERPGTKSNRWMTSIVLEKKFKYSRDQLIKKLRQYNIDSRPFFYPLSKFPMYEERNTPIAHHLSLNGLNLPSGLTRSENEIDYICKVLIKLLT